jgi:8-amino-7-oxononanoate synthase
MHAMSLNRNTSRFDDLAEQLQSLRNENRYRELVPRRACGTRLVGPDGQSLINFGSNDYLGLASNPLLSDSKSGIDAIAGATASALVCGWSEAHEQLAATIADFESTERAVLFPSGYAACSGTVATLARQGDLILSDSLNHASLIDGCRLSRARRIIFPHGDVNFIERTLHEQRSLYARVWIVTESVFSMDGDVAPLTQICDCAERFGADLVVDEAHATGVLGATGSGLCEVLGIRHRVAVRLGTLSKAIGTQGGFVAADQVVIDYLINHCRSLIFSTSLSPLVVTRATKHIEHIRRDATRRESLASRIAKFHELRGQPALSPLTPIVPIVMGECGLSLSHSRKLREAGFFVPAIRPPTVPPGTSRLRVSLSAGHTADEVQSLVNSLKFLNC